MLDVELLKLANQILIHPLLDGLMLGLTTVGFACLPLLGLLLYIRGQRHTGGMILWALW